MTASSAGASSTRVSDPLGSVPSSNGSLRGSSGRTSSTTNGSLPSSTVSPGRPPEALSVRGSVRSRMPCSTRRRRRSACRAMSCSAARCAIVYGSIGRIARPGGSIIRPSTSRRSPSLNAAEALDAEVRDKGFTALKTNIFLYEGGKPRGWRPGFGVPFLPELNVDKDVLRNVRTHLAAMRDGAGPDVDLLLDLNFNAKTEGYLKSLKALADFDMFWVEVDSYSPEALGYIRRQSPHPVSSCETLLRLREFLPYFRERAMDVTIIDAVWNGVWQAMKIAGAADAFEVNVAPHNFYGHLATMMNAHFAAAVPNLRIMEIDIDRLSWDEEVFTAVPQFENGHLVVPDTPGWGTEPIEEAIKAHPPKGPGGLLHYRQP